MSDLKNFDFVTDVNLASAGDAATANVGDYAITGSGATGLSNYNITYVNGLMTVNPIGFNPNQTIADLSRPILSVANKVIVNDTNFEAIETRTLDTDVALRYRGSTTAAANTGNAANVLASLEPAAGGHVSASDLANLEPAAGGDIACANDFLDNKPCANPQGGVQ